MDMEPETLQDILILLAILTLVYALAEFAA